MSTTPNTDTQLSPLDRIRQAEAEVTRHIAAAREAAENRLAETRNEARLSLDDARKAGRRQGQAQYRQILAQTEEESRLILTEAHGKAEKLRRKGSQQMDRAVCWIVTLICKIDEGGRI